MQAWTCRDGDPQLLENSLELIVHRRIPEPKGSNAERSQVLVTGMVSVLLRRVVATVELDRQPQLRRVEVEHVGRHRVLSAELDAVEPAASQQFPEEAFAVGDVPPQLARVVQQFCR